MNDNATPLSARKLRKKSLLMIIAALAVGISTAVQANGNKVSVGIEQISIPGISDFENYTDDPSGRRIADLVIGSDAKLLSFQAQSGPLKRYLIVKVPRAVISDYMTIREFRTYTAYSRDNFKNQEHIAALSNNQALERRAPLNAALAPGRDLENIKFDTPVPIGIDRDDNVAFTDTVLTPVTVTVDSRRRSVVNAMCTSAILIKGKYIIAQLFAPGGEVEWARSTCNKFVADLAEENK
ncbi:hypothetical protein [Pandoraea sputorum]|uniref:Uncharacterized protein n=1 Tax=Pandoraea sputorum TaxID=93222 RepID=A0A239S9T1_9BURK|nr:hypothetical protein [Pandoraea sputorum]SNU82161.1 Uncharacterised protein [Pandoraea sputorum]VVD59116.1 hypothetical protein PSP20601_00003 [Pandoraea sputorum]